VWKKPNREDGKNELLKIRNQQLFSLEMSETVQYTNHHWKNGIEGI
jgi:hypothetical protein